MLDILAIMLSLSLANNVAVTTLRCNRFQLKRRRNASAAGAPPRTPYGSLHQCSPDSLAGFRGGETGEGQWGEDKEEWAGKEEEGKRGEGPPAKLAKSTNGVMGYGLLGAVLELIWVRLSRRKWPVLEGAKSAQCRELREMSPRFRCRYSVGSLQILYVEHFYCTWYLAAWYTCNRGITVTPTVTSDDFDLFLWHWYTF